MSIDEGQLLHPAAQAVADLDAALGALLDSSLWTLADEGLLELVDAQQRAQSRLDAAVLASTRELDARGLASARGATSTKDFLRARHLISPSVAADRVKLAKALDQRHEAVGAALRAGEINLGQAREIAKALDKLPENVTAAGRADAETALLREAAQLDPDQLKKFGKALREYLDPDGGDERDRDAVASRTLSLYDLGDGTHRIAGILDDLGAATLKAGLDPLAAPRPAEDGTMDPRSPGRRLADALVELAENAMTYGEDMPTSRGARPHLIVTAGLDTLMRITGSAPATTASGEALCAEVLRRIACDADVSRVFTDPEGVPLDVGRRVRLVTNGMWIGLVTRDRGCVFPGCTRPASWTQAHHIVHWADLGDTSLDDLALLCLHHHTVVHRDGWDMQLGPDRRPELLPPSWIDSERKPRRNDYWRTPRQV